MTTPTPKTAAAALGLAPCGHAVFAVLLDPAHEPHVGDAVADARRRGLAIVYTTELPGPGALQPRCPRCRARPERGR